LCAPHSGIGADGILLVGEASKPGPVAEIRIFNPDGSEAELSGNGVRQAVMYLRRSGWVEEDSFTVLTAAGEVRPRIHGELCTMDIGRARLRSSGDFPSGDDAGRGSLRSAGREFAFQFVQVGNPQCAIELSHDLFPRRTNVSFWRRTGEAAIRARIFERGVGETMSSGTGASGAAVAAVLGGVRSPVTVTLDGGELEVAVQEDLTVSLTGWARPVFSGTLADEFLEELHEAQ
jgi:diaminopimelate epimerase